MKRRPAAEMFVQGGDRAPEHLRKNHFQRDHDQQQSEGKRGQPRIRLQESEDAEQRMAPL